MLKEGAILRGTNIRGDPTSPGLKRKDPYGEEDGYHDKSTFSRRNLHNRTIKALVVGAEEISRSEECAR